MTVKKINKFKPVNNSESYDVVGDGKMEIVSQIRHSWPAKQKFPIFPRAFTDICRRDHCWLRHVNYSQMALEMVLEGVIEYRDGNRRQIAAPGTLFVIIRGSNVRIRNIGSQIRRKMTLLVSGNSLSSITESLGFYRDTLFQLSDPVLIESKIRRIGQIIATSGSVVEASQLTYELLLLLAEDSREQRLPEDLQQAVELLQENFTTRLTVEQLAAAVGLSTTTLRRRFTEYFSISPLEYLNSLRIRHAENQLRSTSLPIKEIAVGSGFSSALHFNIAFKKYFRQTPGDYRKSNHSR